MNPKLISIWLGRRGRQRVLKATELGCPSPELLMLEIGVTAGEDPQISGAHSDYRTLFRYSRVVGRTMTMKSIGQGCVMEFIATVLGKS